MTNLSYDKDINQFRIEKDYYAAERVIKTYAIHDYYSKKYYGDDVDKGIHFVRRQIYDFKDGRNTVLIINKFVEAFKSKGLPLNNACIVVIPASDPDRSRIRFKTFANVIANRLGIKNSYEAITTVAHEATKGHAGGDKIAPFTFDSSLYAGKNVYLFDDISTSGTIFKQVAAKLIKTGASNVVGIFLAKTVSTFTNAAEVFPPEEPEYDFDGLNDYNEPPEPEEPDWW